MKQNKFVQPEPRLVAREPGGWLALSPPNSTLRIGVVGTSKADAKERFAEAVAAWRILAELPEPDRAYVS